MFLTACSSKGGWGVKWRPKKTLPAQAFRRQNCPECRGGEKGRNLTPNPYLSLSKYSILFPNSTLQSESFLGVSLGVSSGKGLIGSGRFAEGLIGQPR